MKYGMIFLVIITLVLSACAPKVSPTDAPVATAVVQPTAVPAVPTNTAAPVEKVKLNLLTNWGESDAKGPALQAIIDEFMAENPGVEVVVEVIPDTDIATKVETSFLAKQEPDIILHNWMGPSMEWMTDGVTVPITPYLTEWGLQETFKESALNNYRIGDDYAAFPIEGFNWPMWYNMKILEKAGVTEIPTTFEELMDVAAKVRAAGEQPFAIGGKDWTGSAWFLTAITAALGDEQTAELFGNGGFAANEDARKFVEAFVALRDAGVFVDSAEGMDFDTMNAAFYAGEAAMMHGGSWSYADLPAEMADYVKLGGIPLPPGAKGATKPFWYSSFEAKGLWITRNGSEKLDIVEPFVKTFFKEANIARFVEDSAMIHPFNTLEVNGEALPPLFTQSLGLDVESVKHSTVAYAPANLFDTWDTLVTNFYVPGTSVDEILNLMDDLYK